MTGNWLYSTAVRAHNLCYYWDTLGDDICEPNAEPDLRVPIRKFEYYRGICSVPYLVLHTGKSKAWASCNTTATPAEAAGLRDRTEYIHVLHPKLGWLSRVLPNG